ncbi:MULTISPECIES: hypothetical protein [unclassified Pseudomonas]|uniref:hypothetical protein n=1 Tax=unclassified Pseudomonas TaxID=196821 RepID=UPI001113F095|nr:MULTISPECIES: hypothetical protein [unclassified Pseudomonas]
MADISSVIIFPSLYINPGAEKGQPQPPLQVMRCRSGGNCHRWWPGRYRCGDCNERWFEGGGEAQCLGSVVFVVRVFFVQWLSVAGLSNSIKKAADSSGLEDNWMRERA